MELRYLMLKIIKGNPFYKNHLIQHNSKTLQGILVPFDLFHIDIKTQLLSLMIILRQQNQTRSLHKEWYWLRLSVATVLIIFVFCRWTLIPTKSCQSHMSNKEFDNFYIKRLWELFPCLDKLVTRETSLVTNSSSHPKSYHSLLMQKLFT